MAAKDSVGRHGENIAARLIEEWGWTILARNWRCEHGEIDIVAQEGTGLVVVEVKTRRSDAFGGALAAVTATKLRRLRRLAAAWLAQQPVGFTSVRVDVLAVTLPPSGPAHVEHVRDAW